MRPTKDEIPDQFNNLTDLGKPIQVFKARASFPLQVFSAALFFLALVGLSAYTVILYLDLVKNNVENTLIYETLAPWVFGAVVALLLTIFMQWRMYISKRKAAVVYELGFAISDLKGVKIRKWDQVKVVTTNIVRNYLNVIFLGTQHTYILENDEGETLFINDSLRDVEKFYAHLQNKTLQLRYQRLADRYNQGEKVEFGPVTISRQDGLQLGKKSFSWETIEQVSIKNGILSLKRNDGKWFSSAKVTTGTIPNLHVLLSFIDQVVGVKAGDSK